MALIVHKYGGTSMGSPERIRNVALALNIGMAGFLTARPLGGARLARGLGGQRLRRWRCVAGLLASSGGAGPQRR